MVLSGVRPRRTHMNQDNLRHCLASTYSTAAVLGNNTTESLLAIYQFIILIKI